MGNITYFVRYVDLVKGECVEEEMNGEVFDIISKSECFQVLSREYLKVSIKLQGVIN